MFAVVSYKFSCANSKEGKVFISKLFFGSQSVNFLTAFIALKLTIFLFFFCLLECVTDRCRHGVDSVRRPSVIARLGITPDTTESTTAHWRGWSQCSCCCRCASQFTINGNQFNNIHCHVNNNKRS